MNVGNYEKQKKPMNRPIMHVAYSIYFEGKCFSFQEKCAHYKSAFFLLGTVSFLDFVFFRLRDVQKIILSQGHILGFWEAEMGPWAHVRIRMRHFGKAGVACVCGVVCVFGESHGVSYDMLNDVFLRCVVERDDVKSQDHCSVLRCHLRGCFVDVKCAKICCFVTCFKIESILHQEGPNTDITFFYLPSLLHDTILRKKYFVIHGKCLKHRKQGPKRKGLRASRPPCSFLTGLT